MKNILLCLTALLFPLLLVAAPADYYFRHLTVEDGLASNNVLALLQDSYGFIWIGTDDGLNRYDGIRLKPYKLDLKGEDSYVSSLYQYHDDLWIGSSQGIYILHYDTESLEMFDATTPQGERISCNVNQIAEDRDGNLWFSTSESGVYKYNIEQRQLQHYPFQEIEGQIGTLLIDSDNQVWATARWNNPTLYKLNKATNSFDAFPLNFTNGLQAANGALALIEGADKQLWLGTWEGGLWKIDPFNGATTVYQKGISHIHSIFQSEPDQLMVGSDYGLLIFNPLNLEYELLTRDELRINSLTNRFVYPMIKDREGGIWVGTYYGGVNYLPPHNGRFSTYNHSRYTNSVSGNVISNFCEDERGYIWITSDDGGLSRYNPNDKHFTLYPSGTQSNQLSNNNLHALCMDGDELWIGTYMGGVNVLHTLTGRVRRYNHQPGNPRSLASSSSYAIFYDRNRQIWIASMMGEINRYNRATDDFTQVRNLNSMTIDIDQDTNGDLWFSTVDAGLFRYRPATDSWKNYRNGDEKGTLISNMVNCLYIDEKEQIWVGTMKGLCRYHAETDSFETIPLDIPNQNICGIVSHENSLWLATGKGLVCYTPGESTQLFTRGDGLQSEQFTVNSMLKASNGKIYAGSVRGFNAFDPYRLKPNTVQPLVAITAIDLSYKEIPVGGELLPQAPSHLEVLDLAYNQNDISLHYASLSYCNLDMNHYAYMLQGFDKEWNYVGSQNRATYTHLPAGDYLFRVKATNNDGVWGEKEAQLRIIVHPPFYWNTLSKTLYLLLVIASVIGVTRYIIQRTKRKHLELLAQVEAKKEHEMSEAMIKFFTTIAHEIRTPVSLIIAPMEKMMAAAATMPEQVRDDLRLIDRNAQRLLSLVNQLLDFRKVEQEGMTLRFAKHDIRTLLQTIYERFLPLATQRNTVISMQCPEDDFEAMVDAEAFTKLVSNLLANACKYTKDTVLLVCTCLPDQHLFRIRVTDNGMGVREEDKQRIFQPFYQGTNNKPGTGIGLSIVKSVVEAHGGTIEVESEAGQGASFIVTLPLVQSEEVLKTQQTQLEEEALLDEQAADAPQPVAASMPYTTAKPVLLIVDDNNEMRNFLASRFGQNYILQTAQDGMEALEKIQQQQPTIIVSDWMMPRMNGGELCRTVRTNPATSHIPFVLLTAKTDVSSKVAGMDCGADAYIEKPFSLQYLEACVKNLLDMRKMLMQKFVNNPLIPLNSVASNTNDKEFLNRINTLIEENYANSELSVDFLAEQLHVSRSGLFAKIKSLTNYTPGELIQIVRLKKAAALLCEKRYRISEICYMVGFNNPSYFTKCFFKQFGIKPGEYLNGGVPPKSEP